MKPNKAVVISCARLPNIVDETTDTVPLFFKYKALPIKVPTLFGVSTPIAFPA